MMKAHLALALLLVCTGAGAALAQTPDGSPPSQETVCDGQTGAAYGLCTAYCEAMDCDSDDPQASQNACDKVRGKFLNVTGQAPPCVVVVCPCVAGLPNYTEALNGQFGLTSCEERVIPEIELDIVYMIMGSGTDCVGSDSRSTFGVCGFHYCGGDFLVISPEEGRACNALVRQKAAEANLTCTPF